jgi:hypothetical protein
MSNSRVSQKILDEAEAIRRGQLLEFLAQQQKLQLSSECRKKRKVAKGGMKSCKPKTS